MVRRIVSELTYKRIGPLTRFIGGALSILRTKAFSFSAYAASSFSLTIARYSTSLFLILSRP